MSLTVPPRPHLLGLVFIYLIFFLLVILSKPRQTSKYLPLTMEFFKVSHGEHVLGFGTEGYELGSFILNFLTLV